ncbi:MAG: fasciclin domain-containing protein [Chloroflexi bacterium]|nr:fasciclin domain-containing protein [Chloroflexota bacterium]
MKVTRWLALIAVMLVLAACSTEPPTPTPTPLPTLAPEAEESSDENRALFYVAADAGSFQTLLLAAAAGGYSDALTTGGPFTVFAPTDEAFEATLEELDVDLDSLEEQTELLDTILSYHLVDGTLLAEDLSGAAEIETLSGETLSISDDLILNGLVSITEADILANNGVIHAIDRVLVPPSLMENQEAAFIDTGRDLIGIVRSTGNFTHLSSAVLTADVIDTLETDGPFTVFAPDDTAFAEIFVYRDQAQIDFLTDRQLPDILSYHALVGDFLVSDLIEAAPLIPTLNGQLLQIGGDADGLYIGNAEHGFARPFEPNLKATNGTMHLVDRVLLPSDYVTDAALDLVETAQSASDFDTLLAAAEAAELLDVLALPGPFTLFAPTDEAFAAYLESRGWDLEDLLNEPEHIQAVLANHLLLGGLDSTMLAERDSVRMLSGVEVDLSDIRLVENEDLLNIEARNGLIHTVEAVIVLD